MNMLWLIAARSGSQSIPHKNIRPLDNTPLLAWRICTALKLNGTVWISTDSNDYASIANQYGATVPFIRPKELATNTASSIDVCIHAMNHADKLGLKFDGLGLLEPTSPFVKLTSLMGATSKLEMSPDAEAIVAVRETRPNSIFVQPYGEYLDVVSKNISELTNTGRQAFTKEVTPSGGFYISRWQSLRDNKTFYTQKTLQYLVSPYEGIEIDEEEDLLLCDYLVASHKISLAAVLN